MTLIGDLTYIPPKSWYPWAPIHNHMERALHDLTREAITRSGFDRLDLSKAASAKAVEATFEVVKRILEDGEDVLVTGFGKFYLKDKGKPRGRNSQGDHDLMLAERRIVIFKCSTALKRKSKLNDGWG